MENASFYLRIEHFQESSLVIQIKLFLNCVLVCFISLQSNTLSACWISPGTEKLWRYTVDGVLLRAEGGEYGVAMESEGALVS